MIGLPGQGPMTAVTRLVCPDVNIAAAAALQALEPDGGNRT